MKSAQDREGPRNVVEVSTGEVKTGAATTVFTVSALGSCIAVIAYDPGRLCGGIAHVMLPGSAEKKPYTDKFRYAEDAIEELLSQMDQTGSARTGLVICLAGAGNVLKRPDDAICSMNISSVLQALDSRGTTVTARSLGGTERRRVKLDLAAGCIFCAEGNNRETILWQKI